MSIYGGKYAKSGKAWPRGRQWRVHCPRDGCASSYIESDLVALPPGAVSRSRNWLVFDTPCCGYKAWFLAPLAISKTANVRLPGVTYDRLRALAKRDRVTTGELLEAALNFFVHHAQGAQSPQVSHGQFWGEGEIPRPPR